MDAFSPRTLVFRNWYTYFRRISILCLFYGSGASGTVYRIPMSLYRFLSGKTISSSIHQGSGERSI